MLTPSETNALIRELKKNREDMLPKCKLKIANRYDSLREALGNNDVDCLNPAGNHWDMGLAGTYTGVIYSLPADFPEVPEVTEGWVVVTTDDRGNVELRNGYSYVWQAAPWALIDKESEISHFGGYIYRSLSKNRNMLYGEVRMFDKNNFLTNIPSDWVKPATPVALRFWSTDVAKACTLGFKPWNADEWPKV